MFFAMDQRDANMTLIRPMKLAMFKRPGKDKGVENFDAMNVNSSSSFLQLPAELRINVYRQVLSRTPGEHFEALHYGPRANSGSALMLTCRQIRNEARGLYYADVVVSLWPYYPHDAMSCDVARSDRRPMLLSWQKSHNGIALEQKPCKIQRLALLISLTPETNTICENFIETDILRNPQLRIKDLYIRICICGALKWLHETPANVISFCMALETFAYNFPTLERINVLYCGQQWPAWTNSKGDIPFPDIALSRHEVRMFSGDNWSIKKVGTKKRSWGPTVGRDPAQVQLSAGLENEENVDTCRLRTMMTWNHVQAHPGQKMQQVPWKERSVNISYYDSWTVLKERCIRNEPSQQSE
jgi:hypothetical protein